MSFGAVESRFYALSKQRIVIQPILLTFAAPSGAVEQIVRLHSDLQAPIWLPTTTIDTAIYEVIGLRVDGASQIGPREDVVSLRLS